MLSIFFYAIIKVILREEEILWRQICLLHGRFKVTCEYGRKGNWAKGSHSGIDLVGLSSKTVYATCDGTVSRTGFDKSYGNFVVVKGNDGYYHWFCHLATISASVGQKVTRVSKIGIMGSTGNSSGPHLHIEVEKGPDWHYNKNLLKPSDYIDFNNYGKDDFNMPKEWVNGSTREYVYEYAEPCRRQSLQYVLGYLEPHEKAACYGIVNGCYLVVYNTRVGKKTGFVKYNGGIK